MSSKSPVARASAAAIPTVGRDEFVGDRGVGRVNDVQVVGEGLGPILERMRRRVGGHVTAGIPGRSAARVVRRHGLAVVEAFVAEHAAERGQDVGSANKAGPEVVADLVAEMADHRAERLAQLPS